MIKITNFNFAHNSSVESKFLELISEKNLKFLQDIFCEQNNETFSLTYNFYDEQFENKFIVCLSGIVKSEEVFSLIEKFAAAVFLEREIYELFGINFKKNNSDGLTSERMFVFSEGVQNPMLKAKV